MYLKFPPSPLRKGSRLEDFALFTCRVKKIKPLLMHGLNPSPHNIGSASFIEDLRVDIVKTLLELSGSQGISLHLWGTDPSLSRPQNLNIVIKNIKYPREQFPELEFVSLENVDSKKYGVCIEPEFITTVLQETEADFLLDISHAFCAAKAREEGFEKYLYQLPLERTYEVHINGWAERGNDVIAHIKINETGYSVLEGLLSITAPKIVTLEYGRQDDRLGIGCPVMSYQSINPAAKEEIIEQIWCLRQLLSA